MDNIVSLVPRLFLFLKRMFRNGDEKNEESALYFFFLSLLQFLFHSFFITPNINSKKSKAWGRGYNIVPLGDEAIILYLGIKLNKRESGLIIDTGSLNIIFDTESCIFYINQRHCFNVYLNTNQSVPLITMNNDLLLLILCT